MVQHRAFIHPHILNGTAMRFMHNNHTYTAKVEVTYAQLTNACQQRPQQVPVAIIQHNNSIEENRKMQGFAYLNGEHHYFVRRLQNKGDAENVGEPLQLQESQLAEVYVRFAAKKVQDLQGSLAINAAPPVLTADNVLPERLKLTKSKQQKPGLLLLAAMKLLVCQHGCTPCTPTVLSAMSTSANGFAVGRTGRHPALCGVSQP